MDNKVVFEAINTGVRGGQDGWYKELILLYEDGTWEKIFKTCSHCNTNCIGASHLRGLTRAQVIDKIEKLYYSGKLEGKFYD